MGKLPNPDLKELLGCIEASPEVIVPPAAGYDSGVHILNDDEYLVISTDPCIGVPEEWFGWLLVHYAASDVALFGARPEFCTIVLLGPPATHVKVFQKVMKQACAAAKDLRMTIITGHTGTYDCFTTLVGACTAYGAVKKEKLITPGGAQAGDAVICTKPIGLETVVNFAMTRRALAEHLFTAERADTLQGMTYMQTCVTEAALLARVGGVHAMHDATEGGLVAALNEMAENSNLGFTVDLEMLPILEEARILQTRFHLTQNELLAMSSTGTLLAAVDPKNEAEVLRKLGNANTSARSIGTFTQNRRRVLRHRERTMRFPRDAEDPYAKVVLK